MNSKDLLWPIQMWKRKKTKGISKDESDINDKETKTTSIILLRKNGENYWMDLAIRIRN